MRLPGPEAQKREAPDPNHRGAFEVEGEPGLDTKAFTKPQGASIIAFVERHLSYALPLQF